MKTNITLSIDTEVRENAKRILDEQGIKMSFYFEQFLRRLISETELKKLKEKEKKI